MPQSQFFIVAIKLFEYGILKKPVLSINAGGDTDYLINKHKLGFSVKYNEEEKIINTIHKPKESFQFVTYFHRAFIKDGPYHKPAQQCDVKYAFAILKYRPRHLAYLGDFSDMWELYTMCTWIPIFLSASFIQVPP